MNPGFTKRTSSPYRVTMTRIGIVDAYVHGSAADEAGSIIVPVASISTPWTLSVGPMEQCLAAIPSPLPSLEKHPVLDLLIQNQQDEHRQERCVEDDAGECEHWVSVRSYRRTG